VVGTLARLPEVVTRLPNARPEGCLPVNEYLQLEGTGTVLVAGDCAGLPVKLPFLALRAIRMGRRAAFNAYGITQGYRPLHWKESRLWIQIAALGRHAAVTRCFGWVFGGIPAWILSRLLCLLTLPGLERNLRIMLDWGMDLVFRNDIVVLAPQRTQKISHAHYQPGDVIIRQGEVGDTAYILNSGEAEVVVEADGRERHIGLVKPGDCFGEIALLSGVVRTATVRCLTPVDVTVLPRDQFMVLAEGYRDLGSALKARMWERLDQDSRRLAKAAGG
nr:cyclic nucleotide-binding domain-containing protein [Pseudomonadota bacterium]